MIEWFPENGSLSDQDSHPERPKGAEGPLSHRHQKTPPPMPSPNAIAAPPSTARSQLLTVNRPSGQGGRPERASRAEGSLCGGNSFRFTHFRKIASANPLDSHTFKTKDLKCPRIIHFQKSGRGGTPVFRSAAISGSDHQSTNHQSLFLIEFAGTTEEPR